VSAAEQIYRCPSDPSQRRPYIDPMTGQVDGIEQRSSYLMNSLLSHKTRRYGIWTRDRFINEIGASNFIAFSERNAPAFTVTSGEDPREDDYDIGLGPNNFKPWIAFDRHSGVSNYLYLDGHVASLRGEAAVPAMFPDQQVLTQDSSYP